MTESRPDQAELLRRLARFAEAVRRARVATSDTVATRNVEIYLARQQGLTVRAIAAACKLGGVQVQTILAEQVIADQQRADAGDDHNPGAVTA